MNVSEHADLDKWPRITVHILDPNKVYATYPENDRKKWNKKSGIERLQELIQRIISLFNESLKWGKSNSCLFEKIKIIPQNFANGFHLEAYYRKIESISTIGSYYAALGSSIVFGSSHEEFINFYYRYRSVDDGFDLFATATGQAWQVFNRFRNFQAPMIIAKSLSCQKVVEYTARPIFGRKTAQNSKFVQGEEISPSDGYGKLFYQFKTVVAESSPIYSQVLEEGKTGLSVIQGGIRLQKKLSPEKFPLLFDHYSSILATSLNEKPKVIHESDPFEFMRSLTLVDASQHLALEQALINEIWEALFILTDYEVKTALRLGHRYINDFCNAFKYSLHSRLISGSEKEKFEWSSLESACQMMMRLQTIPLFEALRKKIREASNSNIANWKLEFQDHLKHIKLHFESERGVFKVPLLECFEGEVILTDTMAHYFHLSGHWYQISFDCMAEEFRSFVILLKECFIGERGRLKEKWMREVKQKGDKRSQVEGEYNCLYLKKPNFLVGDTICPRLIELFDLLQIVDNKIYLYQVKEEFSHKARDAASQIINAAKLIKEACEIEGHTLFKEWVEKLKSHKNQLKGGYEKLLQLAGVDEEDINAKEKAIKWLSELFRSKEKKNIVFVYAFANKTATDRHLQDDILLVQRITEEILLGLVTDFDPTLAAGFNAKLTIEAMLALKYLDTAGKFSWEFFSCTEERFVKSFEKYGIKDAKKLFSLLRKRVISQFESTVARSSILEARKKVEKHGFTFKICQILHKDAVDHSFQMSDSLSSILSFQQLPTVSTKTYIPGDTFKWNGKNYQLQAVSHEGDPFLNAVGGTLLQNFTRKQLVQEIRKTLSKDYLEKLALRLVHASLPTSEKKALNAKFFKKYLKAAGFEIEPYLIKRRKFEKLFEESTTKVFSVFLIYFTKMSANNNKDFIKAFSGKNDYKHFLSTDGALLSDRLQPLFEKNMSEIKKMVETPYKYGNAQDKKDLKTLFKQIDLKRRDELENTFMKQGDLKEAYLSCLEHQNYPYLIEEIEIVSSLLSRPVVLCYESSSAIHYQWINPSMYGNEHLIFMNNHEKNPLFYPCVALTEPNKLKKRVVDTPLVREGSTIKYGNVKYQVLLSPGDGLSALHALLGVVDLSRNLVQMKETRTVALSPLKKLTPISSDIDKMFLFFAFIEHLNGLLNTAEIENYDQSLFEALDKHFVSKNDSPDVCFKSWLDCILKDDYYLSSKELELIAEFYNKKIKIIDQAAVDLGTNHDIPDTTRLIFKRGLHFSLCKKID